MDKQLEKYLEQIIQSENWDVSVRNKYIRNILEQVKLLGKIEILETLVKEL